MAKNKKTILIFFGPPGCGKGTQSDMVGAKLKLPVISPGELLRSEEEAGTAVGRMAEKKMADGELVSDEIIEKILDRRLAQNDAKAGFILDGYPRSFNQFELMQKRFARINDSCDAIIAVYIRCSDKEVKRRITGRRVCECGASYHTTFNPPLKKDICDLCGQKLQLRDDDKPAVLNKRLKLFHAKIEPLAEEFKKNYVLITVDGDRDVDDVKVEIQGKLKQIM